MRKKIKWTTYLAGGMENVKKQEMNNFREEIKEKLKHPDIFIYNPVDQESEKVDRGAGDHIEYVTGLKRGGKWTHFFNEMWKIWFGKIEQTTEWLVHIFINLRMRKLIDGNFEDETSFWGDYEAVIRSDFIIVHWPIAVKSVGTGFECMTAMIFGIPIYLIVPDGPATQTNSTLLFCDMVSNKKNLRFYKTVTECIKAIKEDYKLT